METGVSGTQVFYKTTALIACMHGPGEAVQKPMLIKKTVLFLRISDRTCFLKHFAYLKFCVKLLTPSKKIRNTNICVHTLANKLI